MDNMDEKAVVQIDAEGAVKKCAKGAIDGCGYKAGAKVCGKCGAMAVEVKADMTDEEDDAMDAAEDAAENADMPKKKKRTAMMADGEEAMNDMEDEAEKAAKPTMEDGEEMMDDPEMAMEDEAKRRMAARKRRMSSMNVKSAEWNDDAYVCGFERKMLAGNDEPCAACPGGCAPEQGLPTLLEVEGLAEMEIGGKALDSGYSDVADLFLVDVERKDGRIAEVSLDGTTGEVLGWQLLDDTLIGEKSAATPVDLISIEDAVGIASKTVFGDVVNVDADNFDGYDAYAVEIDGIDGKSYDVFVSLDGKVLGYDEYEGKTEEDAEMELKRAYSEEARASMAEEGIAMEDGSFPIKTVADLRNAITAYGRAKDKEKAKAHIIKRARALMEEGMIPEEWMKDLGKSLDTEIDVEVKAEEDPEFFASLMEFEILSVEEELGSVEEN